ncbi:MAG TPA: serine/threonine-protein kinase, partial [Polyangiaceae bacterium]
MKDLWVQLPEEVREGDELAGKYRIGPIIGVGASSIVVAARDLPDGRQVAIKFLRGGVDANSRERGDEIVRFVREAHAAMSIPNERVVRVFEVALLDSGMPYIVMEHLEGADLANTLLEQGPLSIENAVDYLLEACEAIADAHRLGIVHRDLKPANLFLVHRPGWPPTVKVLDFGISKRTIAPLKANGAQRGKRSVDITDASTILGTPFYMSPEQMESTRDVDARADIWSLGVTLFELLTTNRPYCGNTIVQMYSKIVKGPPLWKQELHGYPAGFLTVLAKCLAPDRNRRYASVGDLARALAPFGT